MSSPAPVVASSQSGRSAVSLQSAGASWQADLDTALGGAGQDPTPHQLLDSALAACTVLTLQLYARRKQIPLEGAQATVAREEGGGVYRMRRTLQLQGTLSPEQRADLLRVANACPIHKALAGRFEVETQLGDPAQ